MSAFFAELALFVRAHKWLILLPLLLVAITVALLLIVLSRRSDLAPMIYTLNPVDLSGLATSILPA